MKAVNGIGTLLLLIGLISLATPAHAANWRKVGRVPGGGASVYVDEASLTVDHDTVVKGWVRFEYDRVNERDGYKLDAYVSQRMVNCEGNRYWLMDSWGYRKDAEPVRLFSLEREWQTPAPDSENEVASAVLCAESKPILDVVWGKVAIVLKSVWLLVTTQ